MAEIAMEGLTKRYPDGTVAVDRFDLTIADGEFIILVGPSGCGKSTTLNMIAGLEDISEGELRIDGERVNERAPRERDIAMVFQSYALYPHMTVRENIGFPLRLAKVDKADSERRINETAHLLDLEELLDRKPVHLSGGQRQRVAMGRAIIRDPKAFLMDEPLSNLDAKLRVQMRTMISRLQKRLGTTTVYVTHDQTEAMTLGDRIVLMRRGVVQQIGSPEELYDHPCNLFVAGFIGSPSMNFLPAEVTDQHLTTVIGDVPLTAEMRRAIADHDAPKELILGLRPEAFDDPRAGRRRNFDGRPHTFTGHVDILESLGSEKLAYLALDDSGAVQSEHLAEAFSGGTERMSLQLVAHLDPKSPAREGEDILLDFDPSAAHLFDPDSGLNLTNSR
ncbi:sn-glycerol-3-phosphate ABC transporter ATP-binding protein UgpC [Actinomadura logoneensis]|uniref:sn-glycerol-3-phosphate ABC transporter ATP-binding protein UgpC n=1 Tax=Actinomadura logoneensis TaxID=2293572 RepID=A0A372JP12_9ACTN|nr:sn-glycerol-3-phosphate ABC transporter ATP-binding protein UgpC [Actinomadura logoneensis]RFU41699.1 sn-glycerol-3-phosphate ABC transporter ATP-binding protein UgpC [Actinomadura logoneensis]